MAAEGELVARQVAAECGETAHVAVLDGVDVVYVCKIDSMVGPAPEQAVRCWPAGGR
ncbi:hypothetical protein [Gandjariella thermophila]|uniref:hypothetical protein n=1 Tax=Gandjariella thermophila TaxID=1931992 RepID=UPI001CEF952B|nr:hypothetical protein [Gandjariella thermophila]